MIVAKTTAQAGETLLVVGISEADVETLRKGLTLVKGGNEQYGFGKMIVFLGATDAENMALLEKHSPSAATAQRVDDHPRAFLDLHSMPEDERIEFIGTTAMAQAPGHTFAFMVDSKPANKVKRYIDKLAERFPELTVVKCFTEQPVSGVTTVQIKRREATRN